MKKLLLLPLALLCGCAREPSPVSALALDRAGNGYRLTAELVRQDTPEDAAVPPPASPHRATASPTRCTRSRDCSRASCICRTRRCSC